MRRVGLSTEALALSDFERRLNVQRRPDVNAVELSALRESELHALIDARPSLDLDQFVYVPFTHRDASALNDRSIQP